MQKKAKMKKGYVAILIAAGVLFVVAVSMLVHLNLSRPRALRGTWVYDSHTEYDFDGESAGVMHTGGEDFAFSYRIKGQRLTLTFENTAIETATYRYRIDDNLLTMAGEEGTTGGVYQLVLLPQEQ